MSAMPLDDEQGPERRLPPGTTRAFVASTATELAGEFASGGTRLALGVALSAAAGAAVWFLGDGTGHWWPWLGLLVLAAGAFVARTRWRLARYLRTSRSARRRSPPSSSRPSPPRSRSPRCAGR